jgi:2-polyprenyl-3-methyl-5-hydroxy-6-metoxy-1,4-benzoquinol methylase
VVALRPEDSAVDENVTQEHYARLAASYDENWAYNPAFMAWMTECIRRRLRLTGTDIVADIGCGTGLYARGLAERASAVVCIDQSEPMLDELPEDERLIPVVASVQDVAHGRVDLPYESFDAILLKEVLHHIIERAAVIAGLARMFRPGGRMLVVMFPSTITYPLFADAVELFARLQAEIVDAMRSAGLRADLSHDSFPMSFTTEKWLSMVRDRYMSLLSHFDDAQLAAGVEEIRQAHPGERVEFADRFAFILGTAA